jgi:prolyl-tRNA editing enzyme YbaK/EbsC (Cys-tRNA(Pro) deacylase)
MQIGTLSFTPIKEVPELVAESIRVEVQNGNLNSGVYVVPINSDLADTASFCKTYKVPLEISTNCIIVEAKRGERTWYAACLILADDMIDVNGKVRRHLDARKISFAPKDTALQLTNMEYGGITPLGLPKEWPILADEKIFAQDYVVIGGGIRGSKILISTKELAVLHNVEIMDITK